MRKYIPEGSREED
jgi:hypothetical protein